MLYYGTRDFSLQKTAHEVIVEGLAPDGGLYLPREIPSLDVNTLTELPYAARAKAVFSRFLPDFSEEEIDSVVTGAYAPGRFDEEGVAPLCRVGDGLYVMELFHGPTLAFKDVALQAMPRLLPLAARKCGSDKEILILVATSGDTGKAALEGFRDVEGTRIVVFYPKDGVSRAQYLQMSTQQGSNTHVVAVEGNFDDCQRGVKELFSDPDYNRDMAEKGVALSSANSINWARLMPQITYYFSAYADLLADRRIESGDPVNFVVPTGNFGDILAGEIARQMGLPVGKLICASNKNDVLVDFFRTGTYDSRREFYRTTSPSMDILVSSNLERLLALRTGDEAFVREKMASLKETGTYGCGDKLEAIRKGFWAGFCSEEDTADAIEKVFGNCGYVMDTHTAVGYHVYEDYLAQTGDRQTVTVLLSTASPYKFTDAVLAALGQQADPDIFRQADALESLSKRRVPENLRALEKAEILHTDVCTPEKMGDAVKAVLNRI